MGPRATFPNLVGEETLGDSDLMHVACIAPLFYLYAALLLSEINVLRNLEKSGGAEGGRTLGLMTARGI